MQNTNFYESTKGKPLKICKVQEKTLTNYITLKKDKKADSSKSKMVEQYLINKIMKELLVDPSNKGKKSGTIFSKNIKLLNMFLSKVSK